MPHKLQLWLGSQNSYEASLEAIAKGEARAVTARAYSGNADIEELPCLLEIQDNVGVININGSLVSGYAGWSMYYGNVGYGDIRDALSAAVANQNVTSILLNIGSGGGDVAGCHDTAQLIARIDQVKPVFSYTGGSMCSAAMWIGSAARKIYASQTATLGNIGIMMVHVDRSQQFADAGLKVTIIRAGTEKALSTSYEPLSDKAKATLEARASELYNIFLPFVADHRGVTAAVGDKQFGQGADFLAATAKDVGLIDYVGTFEDAFSAASAAGAKASPKTTVPGLYSATNNTGVQVLANTSTLAVTHNPAIAKGNDMPKSLTTEQLAAMAAGVELPTDTVVLTAEEQAAADAANSAATLAAAEALAATEAAKKPTSTTVDASVALLQNMLASAQETLVTARMEAKTAVDALAAVKPAHDSLLEIARASVRTMGLHFGLSKESAAAMSAAEVLAEHGRLSGLFQEKFKVGGVAATSPEKSAEKASAVSPQFLAVLKSTQAK